MPTSKPVVSSSGASTGALNRKYEQLEARLAGIQLRLNRVQSNINVRRTDLGLPIIRTGHNVLGHNLPLPARRYIRTSTDQQETVQALRNNKKVFNVRARISGSFSIWSGSEMDMVDNDMYL